ncbi:hypothetical protein ABPG72_011709 [Tetrahymena utriculariae]
MKQVEVKDTYINDSLSIKYQDKNFEQQRTQYGRGIDNYQVDYRVKNVEQEAEQQYYQRFQKERMIEEQKKREQQLQQELQYSAYNYHLIQEQQKRTPQSIYSINQFLNTPSPYTSKKEYSLQDANSYSDRHTPNFKSNSSQNSSMKQNFANQDELANDIFSLEIDQNNINKNVQEEQLVKNIKSNEYILNYLNNDDFNFNERKQKTFVERKLEEQEIHNHSSYNGKLSKHCSACQRKKQQEENKQKEFMYNGVNLNLLLLECKEALQKKYYKKSEALLLEALQKGIEHADVYYLIGETYRLQNLLDEAENYLLQALLFQFHSPYTYNSLGQVYMAKGQYERSIKLFKKFVETNEEPKAFFNIATCLVKQKEYLDSLVYFGRAIELDETEPVYYLHRADANEALGFVDMSLQDYRLYKKFSRNGLQNLEVQYQYLMKNGRIVEARNLKNYIKKIESA